MAPKRVESKGDPPLKQIEKDCSALLVELLRSGSAQILVVMPDLGVADHRRVAHSHEHHLPDFHAGIQRQRQQLAAVFQFQGQYAAMPTRVRVASVQVFVPFPCAARLEEEQASDVFWHVEDLDGLGKDELPRAQQVRVFDRMPSNA